METTTVQLDELREFQERWGGELAADLATKLTCSEADAIAGLHTATGRPDLAAEWINQHSYGDDEGDSHHRDAGTAIAYELAVITASVENVELSEEEPECFGAGHLVLYREDNKGTRFAITERTDKPADDETRAVIGWHWCAESYQPGGWRTDAEGETTADDLDPLTYAAWTWAIC